MKHFYIWALLLSLFAAKLSAQQDAQFIQYLFNKLYFNPAYAGNKCMFCATANYRKQWLGLNGAPTTANLTAHGTVLNDKLGLGLAIANDQIGLTQLWNVEGSYAYRIQMPKDAALSIGLRTSVNFMRFRWADADATQVMDNTIATSNYSKTYPNFGVGAYYETPKYFVGISIPHLFQTKIDFRENNTSALQARLQRHYFIMGGGILNVNKQVKFYPSAMIKFTANAPLSADFNANFIFLDKFWAGVGYRLNNSVHALIQYAFAPNFKMGFSYDYATTRLQNYNSGTLEVSLEYCVAPRTDRLHNPRFF